MKHIGGFFELEIPGGQGPWHVGAVELSMGRACIGAVLMNVKPRRLHLPFYICNVVVEQAISAGVQPVFYGLGPGLRPLQLPGIEADDMLLVVNYFGLQTEQAGEIGDRLGYRCIIDNTQAFFDEKHPSCWSVYSARKFFGVPDGAYLHAPVEIAVHPSEQFVPDIRHLVNRLAGRQQTAYRQCRAYEASIPGDRLKTSEISHRILSSLDYPSIRKRRRENFALLHDRLGLINAFDSTLGDFQTPMCYPLLLDTAIDHMSLAKHQLYVPTLWQDVLERPGNGFEFEREFARRLLPLPIDQRYDARDMEDLLERLSRVIPLGKL